jgi:hypothetical protein
VFHQGLDDQPRRLRQFELMAGNMFRDSEQIGSFTTTSVESYGSARDQEGSMRRSHARRMAKRTRGKRAAQARRDSELERQRQLSERRPGATMTRPELDVMAGVGTASCRGNWSSCVPSPPSAGLRQCVAIEGTADGPLRCVT